MKSFLVRSVSVPGDNAPADSSRVMTYQHKANDDELSIRFCGAVTHHDIVDCCVEMAADPNCENLDYAVIDFSSVSDCSCSAPDLALIATASRRLVGSRRSDPRVFVIMSHSDDQSQLRQLAVDGRVELCGTGAQARERIDVLRRAG
jgi:hypothetical protein